MNTKLLVQRRALLNTMTYQSARAFGGGHGHGDHHHAHHNDASKRLNTQFQVPTQEDLDYQLPKKGVFNERVHQWIARRWAVDRDDILNNDKPNKYAAYYWFQNYSFLQSKLVLNLTRLFFDNHRDHYRSHHEGFAGGIKTSENGVFLYKSTQGDYLIRSRMMDYFFVGGGLAWLSGASHLILVPLLAASLSLPRKLAVVHYFTFHAELLPHTEQVVFHKADLFGRVKRVIVDIKNLEKIDADIVPSKLLWGVNMFD